MTILSTTPPAVRPRFAVPRYASWQDAMKDAVRDPDELVPAAGLAGGIRRERRKRPRGSFRCSCRADSWPGCGRAIRPIRCCDRCCRWPTRWPTCPGSSPIRSDDAAATRQPGLLQKYRRPRAARSRPARAPSIAATASAGTFRTTKRRARSTIGGRRSMRSRPTIAARSDPQRRRSADARRCDARGS